MNPIDDSQYYTTLIAELERDGDDECAGALIALLEARDGLLAKIFEVSERYPMTVGRHFPEVTGYSKPKMHPTARSSVGAALQFAEGGDD